MDGSTHSGRRDPVSRLISHVSALGAAMLTIALVRLVIDSASPIPFGDESAHLAKLFELQDVLMRSRDWLESFNRLAITGDAYPNTIYAITLPLLDETRSIDDARGVLGWLAALHAWVAMTVGGRLWGKPAAVAYVCLACLSPIVLSHHGVYLLDTALVSTVGISLILCEATEGFRSPRVTTAFVIAAALALLTKWTALLWLAGPTVWQCWRAVATPPAPLTLKAQRGVLMLAVSVAGVTVIALASRTGWAQAWRPEDAGAWGPLALYGIAAILTAGLTLRALSPYRRALLALLAILLLAGTWYAMRMPLLLERMHHETTTGIPQDGPTLNHLSLWLQTLRMLVHGGEFWLVFGLALASWRRRAEPWARMIGLTLGVWVTVRFLPFNTRYLLPVAPMLAGIAVGSWSAWSTRKQWAAAVFTVGASALIALAPLPTESVSQTWSTARIRVPYLDLSKGLGSPPVPLDKAATGAMLDTLSAVCPRACTAHLTPHPHGIQDRAVRALGMTRGLDVRFGALCLGPEVPLPGTMQTLTVCDAGP